MDRKMGARPTKRAPEGATAVASSAEQGSTATATEAPPPAAAPAEGMRRSRTSTLSSLASIPETPLERVDLNDAKASTAWRIVGVRESDLAALRPASMPPYAHCHGCVGHMRARGAHRACVV